MKQLIKRIFLSISVLLIIAFTASCTYDHPEGHTLKDHNYGEIVPFSPEESKDISAPPAFELEVQHSDDEIAETPDYVHFVDETGIAQSCKITVNVSENVNSFSFIELDESVALKVGKTLYVHDAWKYEKPLLLHTYINDVTRNRGVSYVDENGEVIYMAFLCDMNSGSVALNEISVGVIPVNTYEPDITDTAYNWKDNDVFEKYFNDYVSTDGKNSWSHIGVSVGKYSDPLNEGYTQFDIYCVKHTDGSLVEYYAVPYGEAQIEKVYKFQFDDSIIPVWIKPTVLS